jgi:hypothetical protein
MGNSYEKRLADGSFLICIKGQNINRDHVHIAPDGTVLAIKRDKKTVFKRSDFRSNVQRTMNFDEMQLKYDWEENRRYEAAIKQNVQRMETIIGQIERVTYSDDFRNGRREIQGYINQLHGLQPAGRMKGSYLKKANQLKKDFSDRADHYFEQERERRQLEKDRRDAEYRQRQVERERRQAEKAKKREEWVYRQREKIRKMEDVVYRIDQSIKRDRQFISRLHSKANNLRPGRRRDEIYNSIHNQINQVERRIKEKYLKVESVRRNIASIQREIAK